MFRPAFPDPRAVVLRLPALVRIGPVVAACLLLIGIAVGQPSRAAGASEPAAPPAPTALNPPKQPASPAAVSQNGWTNLFPALTAVSAVSATNVWAVGEYGHLLHYSGSTWTAVDPPAWFGLFFTDISMAADGRGWAVAGERAFQYDGTQWVEHSDGLADMGLRAARVSTVAANDAWAVAAVNGATNRILHWDGTRWHLAMLPQDLTLYDVRMISATDGWLIGDPGTLLHYDGVRWSVQPATGAVPPHDTGGDYSLRLAVGASGEIWALAGMRSIVYRYRAGVWDSWTLPGSLLTTDIYASSPTSVWVTTTERRYAPEFGSVLRWDGGAWTTDYTGRPVSAITGLAGRLWAVGWNDTVLTAAAPGQWALPHGGPTATDLYDVTSLGADDAWAVGKGGVALHGAAGTWTVLSSTVSNDLLRIQMLSPTSGYAVGDRVIAAWDGIHWSSVATPPASMWGLALTGPGAGWAIGSGGAVWRLQGTSWTAQPSFTNAKLSGIAFDSPTHGWAVGGSGGPVLFEYTNGIWTDRTSTLPASPPYGIPELSDIVLDPARQTGYIFSGSSTYYGRLLILQNGTWVNQGLDVRSAIGRLALNTDGLIYTPSGDLLAYSRSGGWGGIWLPSREVVAGALLGSQGGWLVGFGGSLLHAPAVGPPTVTPTPTATATPTNSVFRDTGIVIQSIQGGSTAWGDYDKDGRPDLATVGYLAGTGFRTILYHNTPGGLVDSRIVMPDASFVATAWGDYDNDGWPDLVVQPSDGLYTPTPTKIYHNTHGGLVDSGIALPAHLEGQASWVDYDHDGRLDLYIIGKVSLDNDTYTQQLYHNTGLGFVDSGIALPAMNYPAGAWGDYDGDGRPDLLLAGYYVAEARTLLRLYHNTPSGFVDTGFVLPPEHPSESSWADYDGDGRLDFVLAARPVSRLYHNTGSGFEEMSTELVGSDAATWGDYDGDGRPDLVLTGRRPDAQDVTRVYHNTAGGFGSVPDYFDPQGSVVAWVDYDHDGQLDLSLTGSQNGRIYRNITPPLNPCGIRFSDVAVSDYFYGPVSYLACRGVIGGYSDGTFRPYSTTTRGQLAKIVTLGFALPIQTPAGGGYTFTDNPPGSTFYAYIETAAARGIVSGYACGHTNPQTGVVEACDGASRPYYRAGNKVSRGQLAKIITGAAGWALLNPATGHFSDVPVGSTFYQPVETAVCYGIVGGYSDGTFRPGSSALRGQISKIAYLAITYSGGCTP